MQFGLAFDAKCNHSVIFTIGGLFLLLFFLNNSISEVNVDIPDQFDPFVSSQ